MTDRAPTKTSCGTDIPLSGPDAINLAMVSHLWEEVNCEWCLTVRAIRNGY